MKPQLQAIEGGKSGQPEKDPLKPHVESRADGVFWVTPKVDKDSGEVINQKRGCVRRWKWWAPAGMIKTST